MEIRPILSALLRHKTAAALIVLEIALSCAIVTNALFIIASRLQYMKRESGLAENELLYIQDGSLIPDRSPGALRREDLASLAAIQGVKSVASVNQIPYGSMSAMGDVRLDLNDKEPRTSAYTYKDDGNLLPTFGLRILAGRTFNSTEYVDLDKDEGRGARASVALITRTLADHLFGSGSAVGKTIYAGGSFRIIGVINDLAGPGGIGDRRDYESIITPERKYFGLYALRTEPERQDEVLKAAVDALMRVDPNRVIDKQTTLTDMRKDFYSRDRAVVWLLVAISALLLAVTALGNVGLASFWVQQRTKQIGVRRALGATRAQILRYFQIENFLLTTFGIVFGMTGAYGINQFLMSYYDLPRLPLLFLPLGALIMWTLGQLAVLGPARRAVLVPPAVATRSV